MKRFPATDYLVNLERAHEGETLAALLDKFDREPEPTEPALRISQGNIRSEKRRHEKG